MIRIRSLAAIGGCALAVALLFAPSSALADLLPIPLPAQTDEVTSPPRPPAEQERSAPQPDSVSLPEYATSWAGAFVVPLLLTLLIEVPLVALSGLGSGASWKAGVLVNTLTNPVAVLAVLALTPVLFGISPAVCYAFIMATEVCVMIVEWRLLRRILGWSNRRAAVTSVVANSLSFVVGVLVTWT